MIIIKDYLFQLAIVALHIFVYHIFFTKRQQAASLSLSLLCALSTILCMSFPTNSASAVDIRVVPLLFGTLYGGRRTGLFLSAVIILYRLCLDPFSIGSYNTTLTLLTSMPLILYFQKPFHLGQKRRKIQIALGLATLYHVSGVGWNFILIHAFKILDAQIIHSIFTIAALCFFVWLHESIIELKRKTQLLEAEADRLQLISNLTSTFAHEIRNPMQVTRGFLQLLSDPDLPEKKREYIRYSIEELDRANSIINDLLSFGKPATEEIARIKVQSELGRVVNILQPLASTSNVEIHADFQGSCWAQVNPQKFNQAFINIMKNAIESMPDGGKVCIRCRLESNGLIEIRVKDQGIGMSPEQIGRVGSPYYSLKENGTGLGMMVAFQMIRNMRGEIQINSKIAAGTEFLIYLPQA